MVGRGSICSFSTSLGVCPFQYTTTAVCNRLYFKLQKWYMFIIFKRSPNIIGVHKEENQSGLITVICQLYFPFRRTLKSSHINNIYSCLFFFLPISLKWLYFLLREQVLVHLPCSHWWMFVFRLLQVVLSVSILYIPSCVDECHVLIICIDLLLLSF